MGEIKKMKKQRILLITRNLPPLVGGMERLNWHMADELSKYEKVTVIAPKGSKALKPKNIDLIEVPLKPLLLFILLAFIKGFWLTLKIKPSTILAGSGLTAPLVLQLSKINNAKSVVYLHGFDITANHKIYRLFWRSIFKKLNHVIVNSTPTKELALQAGVVESNISIVCPGVEIPTALQSSEHIEIFKKQHDLTDKKILLSVGRLTTRKGLKEFVEQALPTIIQAEPSTMLVVVGEPPKNSLGAGIQTIESIMQIAKQNSIESHIQFLGVITDKQKLSTIYEAADIHVFPVRHIPDDPEGFGMVAVEAAAHGTPTVAFATGGVVDAVRQGKSGWLVEKNNYQALAKQVVEALKQPRHAEQCQGFAKEFEWCSFGKQIAKQVL